MTTFFKKLVGNMLASCNIWKATADLWSPLATLVLRTTAISLQIGCLSVSVYRQQMDRQTDRCGDTAFRKAV